MAAGRSRGCGQLLRGAGVLGGCWEEEGLWAVVERRRGGEEGKEIPKEST